MVIGNDNAGSLVYASWVAFGVWVGWCGRRNLNRRASSFRNFVCVRTSRPDDDENTPQAMSVASIPATRIGILSPRGLLLHTLRCRLPRYQRD